MAAVDGEGSLRLLSSADPPLYLSPSSELSRHARTASRHLYSSLLPFCPKPKPPLDELLVDESFDAEQIWCQIDLVSRPIVSMLRREIRRIERDPPKPAPAPLQKEAVKEEEEEEEEEDEEEEEEEEDEEDEVEEESDEEEEKEGENGVEDEFLKIKDLEEYLEDDEEREFGEIKGKQRKKKEEEDDDEDDDEEEEEEEDDEVDLQFVDDDEDSAKDATYEDYYGGKNKRGGNKKDDHRKEKKSSRKHEFHAESEELDLDDEEKDDSDVDVQENGTLSTHEKQLRKIQSKIEQMEKANLEPKSWTMQGEVTAAKRPKNSALEVEIEFEHNMKPPPAATEESTASLEDLIRKRITEGRFDDAQRMPALPAKPPKELKELDENKSKKGLAEIYEEEYTQQTGLASTPISFSDEQKEEASNLFKRLCLKLDALSHFHYAPKPVIEDMSIQANVPALAMEEIAPVAVSDAAMLAPEEVFKGRGDIKEDKELTQAERKRRRANKKRKFKEDLLFGHDERLSHDSEFLLSGCHGRSFSAVAQCSQCDCSMHPECLNANGRPAERGRRLIRLNENMSENGSSGVGGLRRIKSFICQWLMLPLCGLRLGCRVTSVCLRYSCLYFRNIKTQVSGFLCRVRRTLQGSSEDIGWLQRTEGLPPVKDGTTRFMELLHDIRNGKHCLPNTLVYLLIPGLFSNHSPLYFVNTKRFFSKMGLTSHIAKIHSEASVEKNAWELKQYIEELFWGSGKRVLLLGHSKGGVDAAAALSIYWPDLKDKVAGLALVQSPYGGSPIASDILREGQIADKEARKMMEFIICKIIKGDMRALDDLTYDKRKDFITKHRLLADQIPLVSFHTEASISPGVLATMSLITHAELPWIPVPRFFSEANELESWQCGRKVPVVVPLAAAMAVSALHLRLRYGESSDGMVTRCDAEVPGSVVVRLDRKLDHAWMACSSMKKDNVEADSSEMCEALLTMLVEIGRMKGESVCSV